MDAFAIVIENPYSPALPILLSVVGSILVLGLVVDIIWMVCSPLHRHHGPWLSALSLGLAAVILLVGWNGIIQDQDENARLNRLETALIEQANYSNFELDRSARTFTAESADGSYVRGVVYENDLEHFTVVVYQ